MSESRIEIYGYSDDNIVVEGGKLSDEFGAYVTTKFLHFSDGTIVEGIHCSEIDSDDPDHDAYAGWRFRPVKTGEGTTVKYDNGKYANEGKDDKLILSGSFDWVRCYESAEGPTRNDIESFFNDQFDWEELSREQQIQIMGMVGK